MPVLIEELHVCLYAPQRLPERDYLRMRRILHSERFRRLVLRAMTRVVRERRPLDRLRITVTR